MMTRRYKKIAKILSNFFGMILFLNPYHCHASLPGAYFGLQLGMSYIGNTGLSKAEENVLVRQALDTNNFQISTFKSGTTANGVGGRLFAGLQINPCFGIEFGYTKFPHLNVRALSRGVSVGTSFVTTTGGTFHIDAYDLVGKGTWALPCHFDVYGKLGAALIQYWSNPTIYVNGVIGSPDFNTKFVDRRYYPTFGFGISYHFSPCVVADLAWNRIQRYDHRLGGTDSVYLGLIYFAGQF